MTAELILTRKYKCNQTLGIMNVWVNGVCKASFNTLELPWIDNNRGISCIPEKIYDVEHRYSPKHKKHFSIKYVKNRSNILIHSANFISQLKGCIAIGLSHTDIDKDGLIDVTDSKKAMIKLNELLQEATEIKLLINSL